MKPFATFIISVLLSACLSSCKPKDYRHDEFVNIPVLDDTVKVKISYPEEWIKDKKVIVWSLAPLQREFFPDSITERNINIPLLLKRALLDSGYVNIEYIGRSDSTVFMDRKYGTSDSNTKAADLESLLNYIKSNNRLKNKKTVLIGHSEGGYINCKVASKRSHDISAMLQLASPALSGILEYQREMIAYHDYRTRKWVQVYLDKKFNKKTSPSSRQIASIDETRQYFKENIEPLEKFIDEFEDMDSIYFHIDLYLRGKWQKENKEIKDFFQNNFDNYYVAFAGYITPQQITIRKLKPEQYYPLIKCPVLAVQGTDDNRVDCYPNIGRMEQLLKEGGNQNFQKMILENYDHDLKKWDGDKDIDALARFLTEGYTIDYYDKRNRGRTYVEDSVIQKIIKWIDEQ